MRKCSICFYYSPSPALCFVVLNYMQQAPDKGDKTIHLPFEVDCFCCKQFDGLTLMAFPNLNLTGTLRFSQHDSITKPEF